MFVWQNLEVAVVARKHMFVSLKKLSILYNIIRVVFLSRLTNPEQGDLKGLLAASIDNEKEASVSKGWCETWQPPSGYKRRDGII